MRALYQFILTGGQDVTVLTGRIHVGPVPEPDTSWAHFRFAGDAATADRRESSQVTTAVLASPTKP